jgi:hypothetical protein
MVDLRVSDIELGRALVQALDNELPITAALWLYRPQDEEWRLILASSFVDWYGPSSTYEQVQLVLRSTELSLPLSMISVTSPRDPMITILRSAVATGPGFANVRFSRNTVDGLYIEDAFIYRLIRSNSWGMLLEMQGGWKEAIPEPGDIQGALAEELGKWVLVTHAGFRSIRASPAFYEVEADPSINPYQIKEAANHVLAQLYRGKRVTARMIEPPPSRRPIA